MKYSYLLLLCALLLASCSKQKSEINIISSTGIEIEWEDDSHLYAKAVNEWICKEVQRHFHEPDSILLEKKDVEEYFDKEIEKEKQEYRQDMKDLTVDSVYLTDSLVISKIYEDKKVVTYQVYEFQAEGQTHSWRVYSYTTFDKSTGKELCFGDIIPKDLRKATINLILDEVDKQKGKDVPEEFHTRGFLPEEKLDYSKYDSNGYPTVKDFEFHNPAIIGDNLVFYFYPSELGSYAEGEFIVKIPRK